MSLVLHTSEGNLPILLYFRECPKACFNFLALCASDYYDGCQFYRHYADILLQTGDPTNTGKGGESVYAAVPEGGVEHSFPATPQRYFDDEGFGGATQHNKRGTLSMAHRGTKQNTNASQFFISLQPQKEFDNVYTCFGEILTQHRYVPSINDEISVGTLIEVGAEIGESGERVLKALEAAAAEVDEKNGVLNKNVKITGATVLYNPFAEGVMSL